MKELWKNEPQYSPAAAGAIAEILEDDLQTRVIWKFNELVKMVKSWKKMTAENIVVVSSSPEADGTGVAGDVAMKKTVPKELSSGMKQSRAKGVSFYLDLLKHRINSES